MPSLIFQGAEVPSNRELLVGGGVYRLGVSYRGLKSRVHRDLEDILINFPPDVEIHAYPGMNNKTMTLTDHQELSAEYEDFVYANRDRLSSWVEYDAHVMGADFVLDRRKQFYDSLDDMCFRPVWSHESGASVLESLADAYPHVVITAKSLQVVPGLPGLLNSLRRKYETEFHVMGMVDPSDLGSGPGAPAVTDVYTSSWMSPMKHGETIVWDANSLHRYPKKMQEQARAQHRALFTREGFDEKKISSGNSKELSKLAIWSLLQYEEASQRPLFDLIVGNKDRQPTAVGAESPSPGVVTKLDEVRNQELPSSSARRPEERRTLPSVRLESDLATSMDDTGAQVLEEVPIIRSASQSMRLCNTCFLASNCPSFKPHAECAYDFSPEVRSHEQLISLLQTVIETQTGRVFFAKFAEDLNGGYPDPTVGKEMDRLLALVGKVKDLQDNTEYVKLTMERRGNAGILSQIFGSKATDALAPPPKE